MKTLAALVLAVGLLPACTAVRPPAPTIDGVIEPGEWEGASLYSSPSGVSVRIRKQADLLFVAVSGPSEGFPTVFIASPERVDVLHASAALGSVAYRRVDGAWRAEATGFDYELREGENGQPPPEELRTAYLRKHAWLSTASRRHSRDREFLIRLRGGQQYLAVSFVKVPSLQAASWPDAATDDTRHRDILLGHVPQTLRFDPDTWHRISQ